MNPVQALGILCVLLLVQKAAATQFLVGGSPGWSVPSDNNAVYNQWAEKTRFQIGDSLLFVYHDDSVLRVTKDDYTNCKTDSPMEKHTDGHTVFTFSQSGPHYFISGNKDNCNKNEKLTIIVLSDRTKKAQSPAPSSSSSPPPPDTDENPDDTPAPEAPSTPNGAATIAKGIVGGIAGYAAAILMAL